MWPQTFEDRLQQWADLRTPRKDLGDHLLEINDWWFQVPMVNRYLHRDDVNNWPDPWQLLNDNLFCDLARALGIVYTVMSLDNTSIFDVSLVYTENHNLVQINDGIYILNWSPRCLLNITSQNFEIQRIISSQQLNKKYN